MPEAHLTTRPELTKGDFVSAGSMPNTYRYPFRNTRDAYMGEHYPLHEKSSVSPVDFDRVILPHGVDYFQAPGVDIANTISQNSEVVVEVAGPTEGGFSILDAVDLKSRPIITNIGSAFKMNDWEADAHERLTPLDRLTLDALNDARKLPFRSESVGLMLVSCLNKTVPEYYSNRIGTVQAGEVVRQAYALATKKIIERGSQADLTDEASVSPRIGLWAEAKRALKADGVFVMKGAVAEDLALAQALGFDIIGHDSLYKPNGLVVNAHDIPYEIVFQKSAQ